MEGTYPLPEAQLDRFMFKVDVRFPDRAELNEVVRRTTLLEPADVDKIVDKARILALRDVLRKVVVADPMRDYAVRIVLATHPDRDFAPERVRQYVRWGASPRSAQALIRAGGCARSARAARTSPSRTCAPSRARCSSTA